MKTLNLFLAGVTFGIGFLISIEHLYFGLFYMVMSSISAFIWSRIINRKKSKDV